MWLLQIYLVTYARNFVLQLIFILFFLYFLYYLYYIIFIYYIILLSYIILLCTWIELIRIGPIMWPNKRGQGNNHLKHWIHITIISWFQLLIDLQNLDASSCKNGAAEVLVVVGEATLVISHEFRIGPKIIRISKSKFEEN